MPSHSSSSRQNDAYIFAHNFIEFHEIFWKAPIGIFMFTPEGRFLFANPAWARMCGYASPQELIASVSDIAAQIYYDPGDREYFKNALELNNQVVDYEYRLRRTDGSILWISETVRAVRKEQGEVDHYQGISIDISTRKKTEHAIRASEERFAKAFRASPAPQVISDIDTGRFLDVNDQWLEMLGWNKEEMIGRTSKEVGIWDDPGERERIVHKLRIHGYFKDEPITFRTKQGQRIEALWSAEKISFEDQELMLSMIYDQTKRKQAEELLRRKNEEQAVLLDCIPTQLWYLQDTDTYGAVNQAHADFGGLSKKNMQFTPLDQVLTQEEARICRQSNLHVYKTRKPCKSEEWMHNAQGEQRLLSITKTPKLDWDGNVEFVVCSATDITEQREAELALQQREQWLQHILSVSPVINYILDPEDFAPTWVSPNVYGIIGYTQDEVLRPGWWHENLHEADRQQALHNFSGMLRNGSVVHEYRFLKKDGSVIWVHDHLRVVRDDQGNAGDIVGAWTDITVRKGYEQQLQYLSLHDQLTGLYNRAYLEAELERLGKSREFPITVISMDLDGLKLVNDTLGHDQGDEHIRACAQILQDTFRASDIVARIGGDEFVALLSKTDLEAGEKLVSRIYARLESYNQKQKSQIPLSLSIGLACAQSARQDLNQVYKQADDFMYRDKLNRGVNARSRIMKALMAALEERDFITSGHALRLEDLCVRLGWQVNLSSSQLSDLNLLAWVHDLGKVGIPDHILFKPGPLNDQEWEIMRQHPEKGHRIAHSSTDLAGIADLILKHHERWDGKGYPLGLAGEDIPIECRILAIADSFDVMTNDRPYRKAISVEHALKELKRCAGTQFDPELVDIFVHMMIGSELSSQ
ncbi:MAG: PAS domain S-box protein [Desulfovermiculus sp.]